MCDERHLETTIAAFKLTANRKAEAHNLKYDKKIPQPTNSQLGFENTPGALDTLCHFLSERVALGRPNPLL